VDLGIDVPIDKFTSCIHPDPANPPSFDYSAGRFLGFIPASEMWKPDPNTRDHENENDPVMMVMKRGHASGLTVGRLNTICSFTRYTYTMEGEPGTMSKEVADLPRNWKSVPSPSLITPARVSSTARAGSPACSRAALESPTSPMCLRHLYQLPPRAHGDVVRFQAIKSIYTSEQVSGIMDSGPTRRFTYFVFGLSSYTSHAFWLIIYSKSSTGIGVGISSLIGSASYSVNGRTRD
jgi:hypothetical protein